MFKTMSNQAVRSTMTSTPIQVNYELVNGLITFNMKEMCGPMMYHILSDIIRMCPGHGVNSILFSNKVDLKDVNGNVMAGLYDAVSNTIVIDVHRVVDVNMAATMDADGWGLSMLHASWLGLMYVVAHELHHGYINNNNIKVDDEEAVADAWACDATEFLAKHSYIEVPAITDLGEFGRYINEAIITLADNDTDWKKLQYSIHLKGVAFMLEDGSGIGSLREYMRRCSSDPSSNEWATIPNNPMLCNKVEQAVMLSATRTNTVVEERVRRVQETLPAKPAPEKKVINIPHKTTAVETVAPKVEPQVDYESAMMMEALEGYADHEYPELAAETKTTRSRGYQVQPANGEIAAYAITGDEVNAAVEAVVCRLFTHLFQKCGYNPNSTLDEWGFDSKANIVERVRIDDVPNANKVFVGSDYIDSTGHYVKQGSTENGISGFIAKKNNGRPMYALYTNNGSGFIKRYTFLPQNKNAVDDNGKPKPWALKAKQGHQIAMLFDENNKIIITIERDLAGTVKYGPFNGQKKVVSWR